MSPSPDPRKTMSGSQERRLQATESSDTGSFVCAYCNPPRECSGIVILCARGTQEEFTRPFCFVLVIFLYLAF